MNFAHKQSWTLPINRVQGPPQCVNKLCRAEAIISWIEFSLKYNVKKEFKKNILPFMINVLWFNAFSTGEAWCIRSKSSRYDTFCPLTFSNSREEKLLQQFSTGKTMEKPSGGATEEGSVSEDRQTCHNTDQLNHYSAIKYLMQVEDEIKMKTLNPAGSHDS